MSCNPASGILSILTILRMADGIAFRHTFVAIPQAGFFLF